MEQQKLIKILQCALQVMFNLIKHLPSACPVEVYQKIGLQRCIDSALKMEEKGRERRRKMVQFITWY